MNTDYTYCLNEGTCIHRRGCKRWIGNYSDDEAIELANSYRDKYIDDSDCINSHNVYDNIMPYFMLDRFRNSGGSEIK